MTETDHLILADLTCAACTNGDHNDHRPFYTGDPAFFDDDQPCRCACQVPTVSQELRDRIAGHTAEAVALLPVVAALAEQARATWLEYRATLDSLGVDDIGEVSPHPRWSWPAHDWATYRDGLDVLGDAVAALEYKLASIYTREGAA